MPTSSVVSRIVHQSALDPPVVGNQSAWWDELDPAFFRHPERFELESGDRLPVRATAAIDRTTRIVASFLLTGLAAPIGFHPLRVRRDMRAQEFYSSFVDSGDASLFFQEPPQVEVIGKQARFASFRPRDGICEDLQFSSPFEPQCPSVRKDYLRNRRNRTAHARLWRHRNGPRPTVVAIHGFYADLYQLNEWFFALPWLYGMGCDVMLFTLPFHGARQSMLSPFSGHGFFAGGLSRMNEAYAQAVFDFRIFTDHLLRERGVPDIGVTGVSLGGMTAALLAAAEPRLRFSIPNVPVASLPDLVLEWKPLGTLARTAMRGFGLDIAAVRRLCAVSSPLTYKPLLPRDNLMIIGGIGDRLAPPKQTRLLWDHWDRCRIHWFPGSHLLHLDRGNYLWQIARFLRGIGFLDPDHPRPRRST